MKVRVNETLAKGLTKRLYDETFNRQKSVVKHFRQIAPSKLAKRSRNNWVNNVIDVVSDVYEGAFIFITTDDGKRKKKPTIFCFSLTPEEHIRGRFVVAGWVIDTKKCHAEAVTLPIFISRHAIERVFLRLNTTNQEEVFDELRDAFSQFITHILDKVMENKDVIPPIGAEINLGSENGMFIGTVTEDKEIVFTTFVDNEKLSESQLSSIT